MRLNQEIREVKKSFLPELRSVLVNGIYVPESILNRNGGLAGMAVFAIRSVHENPKDTRVFGYSFVVIPNSFSSKKYSEVRKGIIAHELSHLLLSPSALEWEVDNEVIRRGYGEQLFKTIVEMENSGMKRGNFSYTSEELRRMLNLQYSL